MELKSVLSVNGRIGPMRLTGSDRAQISVAGLLLYLILIFIAGFAIGAADWADHLALVLFFGIVGALVGALLAYSLFSDLVVWNLAAVYGLFLTGWQFSNVLDPALLPRERVLNLLGRLGAFFSVVAAGEENPDPLMVVLIMAAAFWVIGVSGSWSLLRRGRIWGAVVPPGLALLINRFYYFGRFKMDLLLALYVFVTLILLLHHELSGLQVSWRQIRAQVASNASGHMAQIGVIVALALVSVSWFGPAFAHLGLASDIWSTVSKPWHQTRDRLGNAVASLRAPNWFVSEFGESLSLDEGVLPPDEQVMEVEPAAQLSGVGRFYWRARTYDRYQDGRWSDRQGELIEFRPSAGDLELGPGVGRESIEFTFDLQRPLDRYLYLPAQPLWVNRTSSVRVQRQDEELVDVAAFLVASPIYGGESYRARGSIATPTAEQLRDATADYPEWVVERYLQIPRGITPRTLDLASEVTRDATNPYEKAAALTAWLRQNIEYQRVTEAPPRGHEPIDWFLFEYGSGFCNFYASAEVVMLRSLGIPARLATGYAQGTYDAGRDVYRVNSRDYHAWPEVYFPGYGWVEFEPTVSQDPLVRPEEAAAVGEASNLEEGAIGEFELIRILRMRYLRTGDEELLPEDVSLPDSTTASSYRRAALFFLAMLAAVVLVWTQIEGGWRLTLVGLAGWLVQTVGSERVPVGLQRLAGYSSPAHRAYQRWLTWWPRLGLVPAPDQTPLERAQIFGKAYPKLAEAAGAIAESYALERFGGVELRRVEIVPLWRHLAKGLWKAWFGHLWSSLLSRAPFYSIARSVRAISAAGD